MTITAEQLDELEQRALIGMSSRNAMTDLPSAALLQLVAIARAALAKDRRIAELEQRVRDQDEELRAHADRAYRQLMAGNGGWKP